MASCVAPEQLVNFNLTPLPESLSPQELDEIQLKVRTNDVLFIQVFSPNPALAAPYNPINPATMQAGIADETILGYLVDADGNIEFPVIGTVEVAGMTIIDVEEKIAEEVAAFLKDPVVSVRFVNFKVSVLGEVARPGIVEMDGERLTILEALTSVGDLTLYGDRENILIIREDNGQREYARVNLRSSEIFTSPYYYLKQNDVIYVEPLKQKAYIAADRSRQVLPWVSAGTSFIALVIAIIAL